MTVRLLLIAAAALLCSAVPGCAHRLDEYLQAATIAVARDHLVVTLHLTPGISVAPQILSGIDTDADGTISDAEQQAYATRVRQDLSLTLDGQPQPLRQVASGFPAVDRLLAGAADIELQFAADLPGGADHRLAFENRHRSDIAIYLVNTLLPRDPDIRIIGQDRSTDQSSYRLEFACGTADGGAITQRQLERENGLAVLGTYYRHGVHHILTGYDHLLFIAALVLGAATLWDLVKIVTAFTVAHSLTLTLAALNLVRVPDAVVEPLIAASIVFVAVQNILWPKRSRGGGRLAVAFCFGLFHGLGFAGGLLEIMHGMQAGTILLAILGFSLGVEAGNQMVLLPLFGGLQLVRSSQLSMTVQKIGSAVISVAGAGYLCAALASGS